MHLSGLDISSPRRLSNAIIDKACPSSSDIGIAREFLLSIDAQHYEVSDLHRGVELSDYHQGVENVIDWMQVKCCILWRRK